MTLATLGPVLGDPGLLLHHGRHDQGLVGRDAQLGRPAGHVQLVHRVVEGGDHVVQELGLGPPSSTLRSRGTACPRAPAARRAGRRSRGQGRPSAACRPSGVNPGTPSAGSTRRCMSWVTVSPSGHRDQPSSWAAVAGPPGPRWPGRTTSRAASGSCRPGTTRRRAPCVPVPHPASVISRRRPGRARRPRWWCRRGPPRAPPRREDRTGSIWPCTHDQPNQPATPARPRIRTASTPRAMAQPRRRGSSSNSLSSGSL